jgi:hypothetical protein
MSDNKWAQTIADLKKGLACIENSSECIGRRFEVLQLEAESLKMDFLKYSLEKQREAVARPRGFTLLIRDRKKIGASLAVTAAESILGGLIAKDKYAALSAGLSGFNGVLQGFGETRWAVSLDKKLVIVPYNAIPAKGTWVTLESLIAAIQDLKTEALQGKRLGTLDNIIQRLQQSKQKLVYIALPIEIEQNDGLRS